MPTIHPPQILILQGPNLNRLGQRQPELYGTTTLAELHAALTQTATAAGIELNTFQSNHEGTLIDHLQGSMGKLDGLILNPGGLTHTSVALADTVADFVTTPCTRTQTLPLLFEVHLSDIFAREAFRHHSYISPYATGVIVGQGVQGYCAALEGIIDRLT